MVRMHNLQQLEKLQINANYTEQCLCWFVLCNSHLNKPLTLFSNVYCSCVNSNFFRPTALAIMPEYKQHTFIVKSGYLILSYSFFIFSTFWSSAQDP